MRSEASRKRFERLGQPNARQRLDGDSGSSALRRRDRRHVEHRRPAFRRGWDSRWCRSAHPCGARRPSGVRRARPRHSSEPGRVRARPRRRRRLRSPETALQAAAHSLAVRSSMAPEPAAGSATRHRLDSSSRMSCVLRATRRANASGRPSAAVCGKRHDAVGAAESGGGDCDGGAQHVHVGVALGHHPPGGFGGDVSRLRRKTAGLLDARPQFPQRAEFGDGEKFVGVGRQPEIDHAARGIERHARLTRSARRYSTALAIAKASSCASEPPALWMMRPSATANGPRKPWLARSRTI